MQLINFDYQGLTDYVDEGDNDYRLSNGGQLKPVLLSKEVTDAVRKRSVLAVGTMQRRARKLALHEYDGRNGMVKSSASFCERRKRMRNKSAFLSRQTHRHYERLLVELLRSSEHQRDSLLSSCMNTAIEIQTLRTRSE
eukprot:IDg20844t1